MGGTQENRLDNLKKVGVGAAQVGTQVRTYQHINPQIVGVGRTQEHRLDNSPKVGLGGKSEQR